jgi:hypothetical protein
MKIKSVKDTQLFCDDLTDESEKSSELPSNPSEELADSAGWFRIGPSSVIVIDELTPETKLPSNPVNSAEQLLAYEEGIKAANTAMKEKLGIPQDLVTQLLSLNLADTIEMANAIIIRDGVEPTQKLVDQTLEAKNNAGRPQ